MSKSIRVLSVEPFAPGDESASVTVQSDFDEVTTFCWPCEMSAGEFVANYLSAVGGNVRAAFLEDWSQAEKDAASSDMLLRVGHFSYRGRGFVIDRSAGVVQVRGFNIDFGDVPCDGYVEFEIERLDLRG
ncbi:hypothetical protein [Herbaspirillum robiniae]|uniref:hypothetical protein n=1 Tax=Herbaspirillum robiniae TaxID=2014887 RepID=UPI003D76C0E7